MNMKALTLIAWGWFPGAAFALSADTKAEFERLQANVKTTSAEFQKTGKEVAEHMNAAKTQTPTKQDDAAMLASWKQVLDSVSQFSSFRDAHAAEMKAEDPKFDAETANLKKGLEAQQKLYTLAQTQGAMEVLSKFGENIRKEFDKARGNFEINAKSTWAQIGEPVQSGQIVHLEGVGSWTVSPKYNLFDADGLESKGGILDYRAYKGAKLGALICRIAKSDKIYGGKSLKFMADRDGKVECQINDTDLGNNVGSMKVEIVKDAAGPQ